MLSPDLRRLIINQYQEYNSYRKVASLCKVSPNTVRNIILELHKTDKKKPGPKNLIGRRQKLRLKRKIEALVAEGQQVTARKLKNECEITNASDRTVRRTLRSMRYAYKEAQIKVILKPEHRRIRVAMARDWIKTNHPFHRTCFTDEKRFNLDGPDSWSSWMHEDRPIARNRRQQGGGNVQVWGILMPGPFLFVYRLDYTSNSSDYIAFLEEFVKPLLDNLTNGDCFFQQDNAAFHVSAQTLEWMQEAGFKTMQWPARSPDLNIIENVWSMISRLVYDGRQYTSQEVLWTSIQSAVEVINLDKKEQLDALYASVPARLLSVIDKKGVKTDY